MARRPRSSWTSTKPGFSNARRFNYKEMRGISVHWPGTSQKFLNASWATIAAALRSYRNYHVGTHRWADIGYNVGITPSGDSVMLAGKDRAAAHSGSSSNPRANFQWFGVLFLLGPGESPTDAMWAEFRRIRADFLKKAPQATQVLGHQQVPGTSTSCPGPSTLRDINRGLGTSGSKSSAPSKPSPAPKPSGNKTVAQMATEVIRGDHGKGNAARARSLGLSTAQYERVRAEVNRRLGVSNPRPKASPTTNKSISQMATEVIDGKHGNGRERRRASLGVSLAVYNRVQQEVNNRLRRGRTGSSGGSRKSVSQLAQEVLAGKHGDGDARRSSLGSQYKAVQAEVNRLLR